MATRNLLLIDNDFSFYGELSQQLSPYGFEVHQADLTEESLNLIAELGAELVVMSVELPDKAGFTLCHIFGSNPVYQRRFSMIDVTKNRNNRRSRPKRVFRIIHHQRIRKLLLDIFGALELQIHPEFHRDFQGRLFGHVVVDCDHFTLVEHNSHQLFRRPTHRTRQPANCDRQLNLG